MSNPQVSGGGRQRLEYLDGLRGFGALAVVLNHYCGVFSVLFSYQFASWAGTPPLSLLGDGRYAVFIFFVLSGFVLSQSAANSKSTLPARLVTRYLRLTVPMLASLIYARLLFTLFPHSRMTVEKFEQSVGCPNLWLHRAIAELPDMIGTFKEGIYRAYLNGFSPLNGVVWTMRKELVGSVLIYVLYRFSPKSFRLAAIGVVAAATLYSPIYLGFPLGAFLREMWHRGWIRDGKWFWVVTFTLAIYLACDWRPHPPNVLLEPIPLVLPFLDRDFYSTISAGLVIYSVMMSGTLRSILCTPIPQFLGRISFALYLVHFPLILTVMSWLFLHLTMPLFPRLLLTFVLFVSTAILIAWGFTIGLDEPLMKQLHRLKKLSFWPAPQTEVVPVKGQES